MEDGNNFAFHAKDEVSSLPFRTFELIYTPLKMMTCNLYISSVSLNKIASITFVWMHLILHELHLQCPYVVSFSDVYSFFHIYSCFGPCMNKQSQRLNAAVLSSLTWYQTVSYSIVMLI